MENKVVVTIIDGSGTVEVLNDLASFTVTVRAKGEELVDAVSASKEKANQVLSMVEGLKSKGFKLELEPEVVVTNYKLEHREGNEKTSAGFQSINTISFTVVVDDKIDDVYKACLKFDSNMSHPAFSIKDAAPLHEAALKQATDNVKEKLNKECSLLGVDPSNLSIQNWSFGYEGYLPSLNHVTAQNFYSNGARGSTGAMGATGPQGPMGPVAIRVGAIYQEPLDYKIQPGTHKVSVAVRVNYVWA